MAFDFNNPRKEQNYETGMLASIREGFKRAALWYSADESDTNRPTGANRLNVNQLEQWTGSAWLALGLRYYAIAGTAALPSITRSGDTNTGIYFPADEVVAFTSAGTECARISAARNLLIGTTDDTPNARLHVNHGAGHVRFANGSTGYGAMQLGNSSTASSNWHVTSDGAGVFRLYNGTIGSGSEVVGISPSNMTMLGEGYFNANKTGSAYLQVANHHASGHAELKAVSTGGGSTTGNNIARAALATAKPNSYALWDLINNGELSPYVVFGSGVGVSGGCFYDQKFHNFRDQAGNSVWYVEPGFGKLYSTDGGASVGPVLSVERLSASPAAGDWLGGVSFKGRNAVGNTTEYAAIQAKIEDPASGGTGSLVIGTSALGGSPAINIRMTPTLTEFPNGMVSGGYDASANPVWKTVRLVGNMPAAGSSTNVAHGLTLEKIISWFVSVQSGTQKILPDSAVTMLNYKVGTMGSSTIQLSTGTGATSIDGRPYAIWITYEV